MDNITVIDTFLKHLYDKGNKGACIADVVSIEKLQRDRIETALTGKGLVQELKIQVAGKRRFKLSDSGIDIIDKHGSYSSFINSLETAQRKTTRFTNVNMLLAIISTLVVIYGAVFTYLTYAKDNEIDSLKIQNGRLRSTVDSLTNEIEKLNSHQVEIFSDSSTTTKTKIK